MDAIVVYEYKVHDGIVDVTLTSEYAAGGITQHMGYVISGTTHDGIYLEVPDQRGGDSLTDVDYALDTPPARIRIAAARRRRAALRPAGSAER